MTADVVDIGEAPKKEPARTITQSWVARAFADRNKKRLAYCHSHEVWFEWTGSIWKAQQRPDAYNELGDLCDKMSIGAANFAKMQEAGWPAGVERKAKAKPEFSRSAESWDRNPLLLGTPRGMVDLTTGELVGADPAVGLTKSTACSPDELEHCPRWLRFLQEATGGDEELILFMQRWAGYCLTGLTNEQSLVFLYGDGGNGKGVFKETISGILGDYVVVAPMTTFTSSRGDKHPTDLASMRGARLVTASEVKEGAEWDEPRIMELTGQDTISARFTHKDFFSYKPAFKLMIVGNHQPLLNNVNAAARRRFCMVPFIRKPPVKDDLLVEHLKAEWPSILRWMIKGCMDWQEHGLPRPAVVMAATEEYFEDQDLLAQWVESACIVDKGNGARWETTSDLFAAFAAYAKRAGEGAGSVRGFSLRLQRLGFRKCRAGHERLRAIMGLELKQPAAKASADRYEPTAFDYGDE